MFFSFVPLFILSYVYILILLFVMYCTFIAEAVVNKIHTFIT